MLRILASNIFKPSSSKLPYVSHYSVSQSINLQPIMHGQCQVNANWDNINQICIRRYNIFRSRETMLVDCLNLKFNPTNSWFLMVIFLSGYPQYTVYNSIWTVPGNIGCRIWDLTHWGRDKKDAISQTTFSNAFSWMKMFEYRLKFHWNLFLRVKLTIFQHWFR